VNQATTTPATNGTAPAAQFTGVPGPASGTAVSRGKGGSSGPGDDISGSAACPAPSTKPGPRAYAAPHTAALGTRTSASSSTANRPDQLSVRCRNDPRARPPCHTSEAPTSTAPPPTSTAAPALAARRAAGSRNPGAEETKEAKGRARRARRTGGGRGPRGRPYAVHAPTPAAVIASSGGHTATDAQDGRSAPPEAYRAAAVPTVR
jgi:hypothetical protein